MARRVGMDQQALDATVEREMQELNRRVGRYRAGRPPVDVRDATAIIVDDGLATGLTALAAVRALRAREAGRIVVAVPVGARESVAALAEEADEVVCLTIPSHLLAVGHWYRDFAPVPDEEVLAMMARATLHAVGPGDRAARRKSGSEDLGQDERPDDQEH
jgi:putative phosphoribosyl transferase